MKKILSTYILFCKIALVLLTGCAIRGAGPLGGDKDETPPLVLKESPRNYQPNFSAERITITFDEFIELNNAAQEITITPSLPKHPEIYLNKRSVVVSFRGIQLQPNTTYTIQFGQAIRDINEGNILPQYQYVFSTGAYLDSMQLAGQAIDALTLAPLKGVKIQLYDVANDTAPLKGKPLYFTRAAEDGNFQLKNLPRRKFKIFALQDANENYTAEQGEYVGFADSTVSLDSNIYVAGPLRLFSLTSHQFRIKNAYISPTKNALAFTKTLDSFSINNIVAPLNSSKIFYIDDNRDSIIYYPAEKITSQQGIHVYARHNNQIIDSVFQLVDNEKDTALRFIVTPTVSNENINKYGHLIVLKSAKPVAKYFPPKIYIVPDSQKVINPVLTKLDSTATLFGVQFDFPEEGNFKFSLGKGAFLSRYNELSDSIATVVPLPSRKIFGLLEVIVRPPATGAYVFELVNDKNQVFLSRPVYAEDKITIPYLQPSVYKMRLVVDENRNGIWDNGELETRKQPEQVIYANQELNIKANWELVDIIFDASKADVPREKP